MIRAWTKIEIVLTGLLGTAALLIASWQMAARYFAPRFSIDWAEEVIVYLVAWAVILAASTLVHEDGHVRADLVMRGLPAWAQRWVEVGNCVVALLFSAAIVWYGCLVVRDAYALNERSLTALSFPMWMYYAALPVGFSLIAIRYAIRLNRWMWTDSPEILAVHSGRES